MTDNDPRVKLDRTPITATVSASAPSTRRTTSRSTTGDTPFWATDIPHKDRDAVVRALMDCPARHHGDRQAAARTMPAAGRPRHRRSRDVDHREQRSQMGLHPVEAGSRCRNSPSTTAFFWTSGADGRSASGVRRLRSLIHPPQRCAATASHNMGVRAVSGRAVPVGVHRQPPVRHAGSDRPTSSRRWPSGKIREFA